MNHFIQHLRRAALATLGLTVLGATALAQVPGSRADNRQDRQSERIAQGVASGQLTGVEQQRMERQQGHINRLEHRTQADGQVTGREALRVEHAQDRASRSIYRNKHDRQTRR